MIKQGPIRICAAWNRSGLGKTRLAEVPFIGLNPVIATIIFLIIDFLNRNLDETWFLLVDGKQNGVYSWKRYGPSLPLEL